MTVTLLRKILVSLILSLILLSSTGCKKQKQCGCGKDVLFTLTNQASNVYFNETGTNIYLTALGDPYSVYYFCNPVEMFPKLKNFKTGDELLVSGYAYWECSYVYQSSNSQYQSPYKSYNIQVTDIVLDMYGKK